MDDMEDVDEEDDDMTQYTNSLSNPITLSQPIINTVEKTLDTVENTVEKTVVDSVDVDVDDLSKEISNVNL